MLSFIWNYDPSFIYLFNVRSHALGSTGQSGERTTKSEGGFGDTAPGFQRSLPTRRSVLTDYLPTLNAW